MRICHVMSADLWAGAEVQLATTAAYLVTQPDVRLTAVLLNEGPLAGELRRLGVPVTIVDEARTTSLGIVKALTRFLRENDIDLVHTHRYKDSVLGTIAARLAGVPHAIRTFHGLREPMTGWNRLKFGTYEALDKAALWCFADLIIAVSRRMAETLRRSGYRPADVTHIHNGIDVRRVTVARSREDVRRELGVGPDTYLIGTAGRLSPVKNQAGLLRAARLILYREPNTKVLVVGGGELKDALLALAAELGIGRACLWPGARSDVYDLMSAMDVFVLPSINEGVPMALLEAMALGKPVVATAVGGVPEVIEDRVTGLLVPPGDDRALADACVDLARDRDRARRLGAQAARAVAAEYTHEHCGQALVHAYRSVAERPHVTMLGFCRGLCGALFKRTARTVVHAIERQRMQRIRRRPEALRTALRSAKRLLIVCHGNIIRSPFAAHLLEQALGETPVSISSAGLEAVPGRPPHPRALSTADAHHVDLSRHTASPAAVARVAASDLIFVMDIPQIVDLPRRFPWARRKTFLLTCLAPDVPLEIDDPVDGDESVFQTCYGHITRAVDPIARLLERAAG